MVKKKILYLGNKLSHKGRNSTGVETLGKQLEQVGYQVVSVSAFSNKLVRLIHMLSTVIIKSKKSDVLLLDTYSTANFWYAYLSAKLARNLKLPYICILHGGNLPNRLKNSPTKTKELFSNAKYNVAPSGYLISEFQEKGFKNLKFIPNTIEIENYPFFYRKVDTPKLLWVRSFAEIYNPTLAIEVFEKINEKFPNAKLCMVGPEKDGSLAKCKTLAKQKNLSVEFTGKLSKEEWTTLAKEYNIFINTTNFDNTPVSVIEAMALGLPVISTNVGGLPYLIDDQKDGLLVPKNDSEASIKAINQLIEHPELAQQLSINAREKVEKFDWEVVKEKWHEVLQ
ncbi:glycosyltransferase family 4 protein [Mesonia sp.]|uniref:glycosyltransferase family 4 protein n=1 Tax=Mesonia sp. TaxID=1960830 RepID=UPI001766EC71|nr:glycosyltransferase family 4 protein [Mesonia sp.]HIB37486.1 glycosyltransferase family 1 protein [Mesonia sp.]HIO27817.1 glycosyltransferase family 1 protein [Flavobacteriaceae bacterium]